MGSFPFLTLGVPHPQALSQGTLTPSLSGGGGYTRMERHTEIHHTQLTRTQLTHTTQKCTDDRETPTTRVPHTHTHTDAAHTQACSETHTVSLAEVNHTPHSAQPSRQRCANTASCVCGSLVVHPERVPRPQHTESVPWPPRTVGATAFQSGENLSTWFPEREANTR